MTRTLFQAESSFLPFPRRLFKTRRPALVAIRARKPWVRLRLRMLGWNVLFMLRRDYLERAKSKEEELSSQRQEKGFQETCSNN